MRPCYIRDDQIYRLASEMTTPITNVQMTADEIATFCDIYRCTIMYGDGLWRAMHRDEKRTMSDQDFEVIVNFIRGNWGDERDSNPHSSA